MTTNENSDWTRRLRPLSRDDDAPPLAEQLRTRRGVVVLASGLLGGMAAFFLIIFAGFGQARVGVGVALLTGVPLVPLWGGYWRLRRSLAEYNRVAGVIRRPHGRIDAGPTPLG